MEGTILKTSSDTLFFFFSFQGETAGDRKKINYFLWNKHFLKQQNFLIVLQKNMTPLVCVTSSPFSSRDFCFFGRVQYKIFYPQAKPSCLREQSVTEQTRKNEKIIIKSGGLTDNFFLEESTRDYLCCPSPTKLLPLGCGRFWRLIITGYVVRACV